MYSLLHYGNITYVPLFYWHYCGLVLLFNWSLQVFNQYCVQASNTTHVACVNFSHEWLGLQFIIYFERQMYEKNFMAIYFNLRLFASRRLCPKITYSCTIPFFLAELIHLWSINQCILIQFTDRIWFSGGFIRIFIPIWTTISLVCRLSVSSHGSNGGTCVCM